MTDVKVTVVEVDAEGWADADTIGYDDAACEAELVCGGVPIGGYLRIDRDTDMDVPAYRNYWLIRIDRDGHMPDIVRSCEDCFSLLSEIAPAIVAFNTPPERTTGASTD